MKFILTLATSFFFFSSAFFSTADAQITNNEIYNDMGDITNSNVIRGSQQTELLGSPYLFEEWMLGRVKHTNRWTAGMLIKIDTYHNVLEVKGSLDSESIYVGIEDIQEVLLETPDGDKLFRNSFDSDDRNVNKDTLLEIIYDGDTKLVKHHRIRSIPEQGGYGSANKVERLVRSEEFYYLENGKLNTLRTNRRNVLNALSAHRSAISTFVNENNLSYSSELDLIKIFSFFDSLD
jgi:hypothetical protein